MALPRFNQTGLFFVPRTWQRASVIRWLKRIHAWTGFWGALLFLLMGTSGFLLNHRGVLKIDTGAPVEVSSLDIAVGPSQFADANAMGQWAKTQLGLVVDPKPPRPDGPPRAQQRLFMGKPHNEAEKWTQVFILTDGRVTAAYVPGSTSVSVKREGQGILSTIKNLHKGVGLGVFWVLFLDSIAGALVAMSLTGFLLWTRLHGGRLLAGAIVGGSLALALAAIVPAL